MCIGFTDSLVAGLHLAVALLPLPPPPAAPASSLSPPAQELEKQPSRICIRSTSLSQTAGAGTPSLTFRAANFPSHGWFDICIGIGLLTSSLRLARRADPPGCSGIERARALPTQACARPARGGSGAAGAPGSSAPTSTSGHGCPSCPSPPSSVASSMKVPPRALIRGSSSLVDPGHTLRLHHLST